MCDRNFCVNHIQCDNSQCLSHPTLEELQMLENNQLSVCWFSQQVNVSGSINCKEWVAPKVKIND